MKLHIDPEFESFIPPMPAEQRAALEKSIVESGGATEPIRHWDGVIVDGHNRYEICTRLGLPFEVEDMPFASRDDVKTWMLENQIARRNMTPDQLEMLFALHGKVYDKTSPNLKRLKELVGSKFASQVLAGTKCILVAHRDLLRSQGKLLKPSRAKHLKEKRESQKDPQLHTAAAPTGYCLKGVSTLVDGEGNVRAQWIKTYSDKLDPSEFLEAFKLAVEETPPRTKTLIPPKGKPEEYVADLLTVYPMGDPHFGMLSWRGETGEDFDLKIAERLLVQAVDKLVSLAPKSEKALIVNLGDFFHSDNQDNKTARSGHSLDVDSRWAKVLRLGIAAMVRCIDRTLEKHQTVRVINAIGNHDDHSSVMLAICLDHHYRDNVRVEIDVTPSQFHWYEFGLNLIGVHHGHTTKAQNLPGLMAADQPEAWGRTQFRYWLCGHVHHESKKEYAGAVVETFRTLAAKDAWHHGQGYRAGRSMVADVYHAKRGRILRHEVGVEQLS